jgi:hypothetical protein
VWLAWEGDVPGQQFVDLADGVVCDLSKDVMEIELRVKSVELG